LTFRGQEAETVVTAITC